MKIIITVINHNEQRYPTVGDWIEIGDGLQINVSHLSDWRYEVLIGVHEVIEALLCKHRKINQEIVDKFDTQFEALRFSGDTTEPGDHPDAPYRNEHFFATSIERLVAAELNVDWAKYEAEVQAL